MAGIGSDEEKLTGDWDIYIMRGFLSCVTALHKRGIALETSMEYGVCLVCTELGDVSSDRTTSGTQIWSGLYFYLCLTFI